MSANRPLKPCPFCGPPREEEHQPSLLETTCVTGRDKRDHYTIGYSVLCPLCGIELHDDHEDLVIERWNTRDGVTPPNQEEDEDQ